MTFGDLDDAIARAVREVCARVAASAARAAVEAAGVEDPAITEALSALLCEQPHPAGRRARVEQAS
jgi:hypothetical protein